MGFEFSTAKCPFTKFKSNCTKSCPLLMRYGNYIFVCAIALSAVPEGERHGWMFNSLNKSRGNLVGTYYKEVQD